MSALVLLSEYIWGCTNLFCIVFLLFFFVLRMRHFFLICFVYFLVFVWGDGRYNFLSFLFVCCPRLSLISVIVLFLFVLGCSEDAPLGPSHFSSFCLFSPTAKKKDNSPTNPGSETIWNIINLVAINVLIPCNNVWHGEGPHLVFEHKIDCPTAPSHPFAPIPPTKSNLSNLVQTKLLQSSPICQPWTKPKCPTKLNLSKLKQNFPAKSNLSEHQLGLQDVRVLKHFILEDNTKVLEVIEHQTCTYLLVHSRINSTLIVRN